MNKIFLRLFFISVIIFGITGIVAAISINQTDTFQDGSLKSWSTGVSNPNPPLIDSTGGPAGTGDKYMRLRSSGTIGAGSKLVVNNSSQWTGNYISAGITSIHVDLKNEGKNALQMRIAFLSPTASCSSLNPVNVPVNSGWITVNFPITSADLTGGIFDTVLSNVTEIRLLHSATPDTRGDVIAAQLGVDNITAVAIPTKVEVPVLNTPRAFTLSQNYPNPFNPSTTIEFTIAEDSKVSMRVFDILGKEAAVLVDKDLKAGVLQQVTFNASKLSSGLYFYRLEAGNKFLIKKLLLLK